MEEIRLGVHQRPESITASLFSVLYHLDGVFQSRRCILDSDPLKYPHRYKKREDQEVVAFLSALFAFGNVRVIFSSLEKILAKLGPRPAQSLRLATHFDDLVPPGFRHRWIGERDLEALFFALSYALRTYGHLEACFNSQEGSFLENANGMCSLLEERAFELHGPSRGLRFLLAHPRRGSTSKRLCLFLRWVVRAGFPDLGLWESRSPSELFLPLDTHLIRLSRNLGWTQRRSPNWKMVEEITANLREIEPEDPTRFDFALSRMGILGECRHRYVEKLCSVCLLRPFCRAVPTREALDLNHAMR